MTNLPMNKLIDEVNNELSVAINKSVMDTQLEESMLYSLNAGGNEHPTSSVITHFRFTKYRV